MPSGRSDGTAAGGTQVSLENQTPKENTTSQHVSDSQMAATADLGGGATGVVSKQANATSDPAGGGISAQPVLYVHVVTTSTGVRDDSKGGVEVKLGDCLGTDGVHHILKVRQVDVCVSGTPMRAMCLISDPF
jgi:hypothetical protein